MTMSAAQRRHSVRERWRAIPAIRRRMIVAGLAGLVALVVVGPFEGIDSSAVVAWAVFVVLYVPDWKFLGRWGKWVLPLAFLALAVLFPYYNDKLFTMPILGAFPDTHTAVVMLIYMMMALGLNVVVGYAGLLDLGYVAFYAIGAYTAASLASTQFA